MKEKKMKKKVLIELLNLYAQHEFIETDAAGRASIEAIIKGKEDSFIKLVEEERNG